jgi:cytochrome bd ubiquinol oxidase subunit I
MGFPVGIGVGDGDGDGLGLGDGVGLGVGDGVADGVDDGAAVGVDAGDACFPEWSGPTHTAAATPPAAISPTSPRSALGTTGICTSDPLIVVGSPSLGWTAI